MAIEFPSLFLASKSPRRKDLLTSAGIPFDVIDVDVKETHPDGMVVEDIPEYLARKKAEAAMPHLPPGGLVLSADSIVVVDHQLFGKPLDKAEATKMLQKLSGKHHLVITGVFIGNRNKGIGFSDYTTVWMDKFDPEEIEIYLEKYQPYDKAGAYGIQEWVGWAKVNRIEGSYANVMGLPIQRVYEVLKNWNKIK